MAHGSHRSPGNSQDLRREASGWHAPEGCPAALSWPVPLWAQAPWGMAGGPSCSREDRQQGWGFFSIGIMRLPSCASVVLASLFLFFCLWLFPHLHPFSSQGALLRVPPLPRGSLEPQCSPESEPPKPSTRSGASDPGPSCCPSLCPFLPSLGHQAVAAAAKSLQLCPTLCDPIDGSPPGSPVPGILQARALEWVAISFSNA